VNVRSVAHHAVGLILLAAACSSGNERTRATPAETPATTEPRATQPGSPRASEALLWVAIEDAREVVLIDAEARRVIERERVPGRPHNIAVARDGTVAATLQRAGTMALLQDGKVTTIELGGSPHDVKPTAEGFVVTNEGARRLDLVNGTGKSVGSIALRANPHDIAVRDDTAWVSLDGSDEIAVVDIDRRRVVRYLSTDKHPHDLLFASDGRGWVTDWDGTLHVFDARGALVKTLALGEEAHHLTFTPDGGEAWITDHGVRSTFVVSTKSLEVLETVRIPGAPHHVAITPDGRWAGVADHDRGTLVIFDVRERREVATVRVGPGPHGVWPSE
jgi:DNA-binding beta-propeller fold protein YncE